MKTNQENHINQHGVISYGNEFMGYHEWYGLLLKKHPKTLPIDEIISFTLKDACPFNNQHPSALLIKIANEWHCFFAEQDGIIIVPSLDMNIINYQNPRVLRLKHYKLNGFHMRHHMIIESSIEASFFLFEPYFDLSYTLDMLAVKEDIEYQIAKDRYHLRKNEKQPEDPGYLLLPKSITQEPYHEKTIARDLRVFSTAYFSQSFVGQMGEYVTNIFHSSKTLGRIEIEQEGLILKNGINLENNTVKTL